MTDALGYILAFVGVALTALAVFVGHGFRKLNKRIDDRGKIDTIETTPPVDNRTPVKYDDSDVSDIIADFDRDDSNGNPFRDILDEHSDGG